MPISCVVAGRAARLATVSAIFVPSVSPSTVSDDSVKPCPCALSCLARFTICFTNGDAHCLNLVTAATASREAVTISAFRFPVLRRTR